MKILTAAQIRKLDEYTIANEPISSTNLMERAAARFTDRFTLSYGPDSKVAVLCGPGNNGGDGLCIARMLTRLGYQVTSYAVRTSDKGSEDFSINLRRLEDISPVKEIRDEDHLPDLSAFDVLIDGLFGSGLSRPVEGLFALVVERMNSSPSPTVSIDIPSGLYSDEPSPDGAIVRASQTFTFQVPKLAFMLPENGPYTGHWEVVEIGLHPEALAKAETDKVLITRAEIKSFLQPRGTFSHKGNYGKACIIAGSKGTMGAAVLSGLACLRSGIGLLTLHIPCCGYDIIQTSLPEAMASCDISSDHFSCLPDLEPYTVIGAGPGIGTSSAACKALRELLTNVNVPMVLDADALNILSENRELLELLPENTILTPHPKEFERLAGKTENGFEQLERQKEFSKKHKVIVVRKGAHTAVSIPDGRVFFNNSGNPGMATGGSGDALTGIITAALGTYEPWQAAILGVHLHGLAADLALKEQSQESLLPTDMIDHIGSAYKVLWS
ncbi:NAD(P)H-hydrate dehydratase [Roseivirga sp. BDSF3-8]|uniref:NAD(P)H-hydrate dehydratase n=1 Tax=Roseivirga sp. BDSF3-8 TaxID=3241598 RepID=UPI003531DDDC